MNLPQLNMQKKITLVIGLLGLCLSIQAQRGWEAGPWAGVSYYFGDLNTDFDLSKPGLAGGIVARYNFNNRIALKMSGNYGSISDTDVDSKNVFERARNLSFQSTILDAALQLEFNFLPYMHGSKDEFFTPYLFGGINAFYFNPKAELDGTLYELRELGTEGQFKGEEYYTVTAGLVYGMGFKIDLSYEWSLNFELSARHLYTDYLDDVSTIYPDKSDLIRSRGEIAAELSDRSVAIPGVTEGPIGQEGRQRGDSTNNDSYIFLGVGLVYYFGDIRCPTYGSK
jgi:hypothetical protein